MATNVSIGFSQHPDPSKAILEACAHVKNHLITPHTDLVLVFATPQYIIPELQSTLTRLLKPKHLVGSSTGGVIVPSGVAYRGLAVIGINSDDTSFGVSAINDIANQEIYFTGFDLARRAALGLHEFHHREVFIAMAEGIEKDCTQFVRGVKESLGGGFPLLGALSSDGFKYTQIYQLYQDQIMQNSAVGLIIGGSSHLALGCRHGFKPLGKPRTITKVSGCVIERIDDEPAVNIYKEFLGPDADGIKNMGLNSYAALYPLGVYIEGARQYLIRNIIDILDDGSIVCHEGITPGTEVHMMISNTASCHASAVEAAKLARASLADKPAKFVIVFESLARHKILGTYAQKEIQAIRDVCGTNTPIFGMCTYGEIGPFGTLNNSRNICLHNESILIIAIS